MRTFVGSGDTGITATHEGRPAGDLPHHIVLFLNQIKGSLQ